MHTLYRSLTGSDLVAPTWTAVGFQNDDFVTDLRGVGMLGPLQMLMFAQKHHTVSDFALLWLSACVRCRRLPHSL